MDLIFEGLQAGEDPAVYKECVKEVATSFPGVFLRSLVENNYDCKIMVNYLQPVIDVAQESIMSRTLEILRRRTKSTSIPIRRV
jgi:hypothetical protein